tara:strand:+ start:227 stop:385 length:159 start_codon:yes stop_codon:yes gene_type:complete
MRGLSGIINHALTKYTTNLSRIKDTVEQKKIVKKAIEHCHGKQQFLAVVFIT